VRRTTFTRQAALERRRASPAEAWRPRARHPCKRISTYLRPCVLLPLRPRSSLCFPLQNSPVGRGHRRPHRRRVCCIQEPPQQWVPGRCRRQAMANRSSQRCRDFRISGYPIRCRLCLSRSLILFITTCGDTSSARGKSAVRSAARNGRLTQGRAAADLHLLRVFPERHLRPVLARDSNVRAAAYYAFEGDMTEPWNGLAGIRDAVLEKFKENGEFVSSRCFNNVCVVRRWAFPCAGCSSLQCIRELAVVALLKTRPGYAAVLRLAAQSGGLDNGQGHVV
jgi:hypothetical protein